MISLVYELEIYIYQFSGWNLLIAMDLSAGEQYIYIDLWPEFNHVESNGRDTWAFFFLLYIRNIYLMQKIYVVYIV